MATRAWRVGLLARTLACLLVLAAIAPAPAAAATSILSGPTPTNLTDSTFTVSWVTSVPSPGYVRFGTVSGQYPSRAEDERGADYVGYTHHVRVTGLLAGTKYYYSVVSSDLTLDAPSTYNITTGATLGSPPSPSPNNFAGVVHRSDDVTPAVGAIVYVYVQRQSGSVNQSGKLSALTDDAGNFSLDVSQVRVTGSNAGQQYYTYDVAEDRVYYQVDAGVAVGGAVNRVSWQWKDASVTSAGLTPTEVEISMPYAEQPTPTASPSATPTALATATPTRTVSPTPAISPTAAIAPTAPAQPTRAPAAATPAPPPSAIPDVTASEPAAAPTLAPPARPLISPTPRATPRPAPAAIGTVGRLPSPTTRPPATPTAEVSPTPIPTARPDVSAIPSAVTDLVTLAAVLFGAGLGLAAFGIASTLRRRAA